MDGFDHHGYVDTRNHARGSKRLTSVRRLPVLTALAILLAVAACGGGGDVSDGPDQADIDGDPPYGAGVEVGGTYGYTLYTHCGIEWTRIDGVWWRASTPLNDGNGNPPSGWGNPYDEGVMDIANGATAVYRGGPNGHVEFERTDVVDAPFACN